MPDNKDILISENKIPHKNLEKIEIYTIDKGSQNFWGCTEDPKPSPKPSDGGDDGGSDR
ncbi:hypothetical protein P4409_05060 [Bacillus thuringiensis]|uniref:hypothetical protein n=1 Tax=Bacillus cereus group TaxID=86661 RepID=UPI0002796748|nr:hypothetical protein [Bacillus cereus]EJR08783.1 hypothetical protein II5_01065 [Bacillus cereus MSX-A1]MED3326489.1 hypothetical protein [Bacillus thuringiensis]